MTTSVSQEKNVVDSLSNRQGQAEDTVSGLEDKVEVLELAHEDRKINKEL
jgi:hypothetical protein